MALSIRDQKSKRVGIVKAQVTVGRYDVETLAISSLALANRLSQATEAERFRRGDLAVVPRLSKHFQVSQPLLVYYEIYNLTRNERGRTWYQTEYTIVRHPEKRGLLSRVVSAIASPFGSRQRWESVSSTTEDRGSSATEIGKLEVDMSRATPGQYDLILTVTDMNSGQRAERKVGFTLVE